VLTKVHAFDGYRVTLDVYPAVGPLRGRNPLARLHAQRQEFLKLGFSKADSDRALKVRLAILKSGTQCGTKPNRPRTGERANLRHLHSLGQRSV
jgi:hypothetical protein